jgi:hypothetical protein
MARTKPKLPTAARRDINMSANVEQEGSSPDGILRISSATNVLFTSRDSSPSPEVVHLEDMNWKRSNDPVELDAPPITMSLAYQAHVNGLVAF